MALAVQQEIAERIRQADQLQTTQLEQARYDVELARRRYLKVDPDNRLVSDALEADTGTNGCDASMRCNKPTRNSAKPTNLLADDAREHILQLAKDFPQVWQDPRTAPIERKRLVALLIDDVTLINAGEVTVQVRFRGGRTQSFTLPRPLPMSRICKTPDAVVQTLDRLLETCTEREAAMRLNGLGHRNWRGQAFTEKKCHWYGEPMDCKVDMNVCAPTGY